MPDSDTPTVPVVAAFGTPTKAPLTSLLGTPAIPALLDTRAGTATTPLDLPTPVATRGDSLGPTPDAPDTTLDGGSGTVEPMKDGADLGLFLRAFFPILRVGA